MLVKRIDTAFGEQEPFVSSPLEEGDAQVLQRVFGDAGYQQFLQDQINRQIIRDYLTNAVLLGFLSEHELDEFVPLLGEPGRRAALSLHMLMSSVEEAGDLLANGVPERLTPLEVDAESPPHIHLVRN